MHCLFIISSMFQHHPTQSCASNILIEGDNKGPMSDF